MLVMIGFYQKITCNIAVNHVCPVNLTAQYAGTETSRIYNIGIYNTYVPDCCIQGTSEETSLTSVVNIHTEVTDNVPLTVELTDKFILVYALDIGSDRYEVRE